MNVSRSLSKRKVGQIREEHEAEKMKRAKQERLLPIPSDWVSKDIGWALNSALAQQQTFVLLEGAPGACAPLWVDCQSYCSYSQVLSLRFITLSHRMKLLDGGRSIQPCGRDKRKVYTAMRNTNGWVRTAGELWCESCCDVRFKETSEARHLAIRCALGLSITQTITMVILPSMITLHQDMKTSCIVDGERLRLPYAGRTW